MQKTTETHTQMKEPRWLLPASYALAISLGFALAFFRNDPWTKGSIAGLIVATCISVLMFRVAGKIALGVPVPPLLYRPPIGEPTNIGWFDRPLGMLIQLALVTCAAALLALIW